MTGDSSIQQALNGMITLLFAKFMLNDVPHMLNSVGNLGSWVEHAWEELVEYVINRGVPPTMVVNTLNAYPFAPEEEAEGMENGVLLYKTLMGGYYLISQGRATDRIVSEVYNVVQRMVLSMSEGVETRRGPYYLDKSMLERAEDWKSLTEEERQRRAGTFYDESDVQPWLEGWYRIKAAIKNGNRFDKVTAIEIFINAEHARGVYLEYCWGGLWPEVSKLTLKILNTLAGRW